MELPVLHGAAAGHKEPAATPSLRRVAGDQGIGQRVVEVVGAHRFCRRYKLRTMPPPALIVHGGAWDIPDGLVQACRQGCTAALQIGWAVLDAGGSSLDAVCAAVRALEDDPTFNAGTGSSTNTAGVVETDASVMVGDGLQAGAVAALQDILHPVDVARAVLQPTPHVLLAGQGALQFALDQGFARLPPGALARPRARDAAPQIAGAGDTVGAVAVDRHGVIAAATSTGGTPGKMPGRVGDSPLIGAGTFASTAGGASATGWGEVIIRSAMSLRAVDAMQAGADAQGAEEAAVAAACALNEQGAGIIVVDRAGRVGRAWCTPRMAFAWRTADDQTELGP